MTPADTWRDAMRRARALDPDRIARAILERADTGIRATTYDRDGGRSANVPCDDPACSDGPDPHSHPTVPDPTGNAALRGTRRQNNDLRALQAESQRFVAAACVVLDFVAGHRPSTWRGVISANAMLNAGTIQAGLDVDDERVLPHAISEVERSVRLVERIAEVNLPRDPSDVERYWTDGLADDACCDWHLEVEPRGTYRRLKAGGTNVCAECQQLIDWCHRKPPMWFMEAWVVREAQPIAYRRALSRLVDELGLSA